MGSSHQLTMRRGPFPNKQYPLTEDHTLIGRATACTIYIPDPEISRQHVRVVAQGANLYAVEDLGSTNGTFVNGRRITSLTPLNPGDTVDLGEALQFVFEPIVVKAATTPHFIIPGTGEYVVEDAQAEAAASAAAMADPSPTPQEPERVIVHQIEQPRSSSSKRGLIGCGVVLLIMLCCVGLVFALDAYDGGRLLYCGPLQSFWNVILLPFGSSSCG
jgi:predicted component of type VI protein secretion system